MSFVEYYSESEKQNDCMAMLFTMVKLSHCKLEIYTGREIT
jgi:hypothetical protein